MSNPYQPPRELPPVPPTFDSSGGDATGGLIPYKNGPALWSYYLGIFSLICCFFGLPLGIVPLVLGIMGLRKRALQPEVKGSVHAWIGIVCGAISTLVPILFWVFFLMAAIFTQ